MQCSECGSVLAVNTQACPACGAKLSFAPPILVAKLPMASRQGLPQPGEAFAGRYRVEKYLGVGSLCNAYLCRDSGSGNREVVLKIMHARKAKEPGAAENFLFLAQSVSRYDHKGIAKVFESGSHEGAPYYVMEWISGTPLRLWLMERLTFENRVLPGLGIIRSLLETFASIHELGCYGCLKPENVFITLNGPVVMDFGVVGFLTPQEFEFNSYARRYIPYMAPELRQDWSNILPHSDHFSMGALLYEVLVGRAPTSQLRYPSELSPIFGIEADEIILKSMAAKPLDRFSTLEAFQSAVASLQAAMLDRRAQEGNPELPVAQPELVGKSLMDVTSDVQSVHNPEMVFSAPEAARAHVFAESRGPSEDEDNPGARTVFFPNPEFEEVPEILSDLSGPADRTAEEAHALRRFAHMPRKIPLPEPSELSASVASEAVLSAQAWENPPVESASDAAIQVDEEEDRDPIPAWLWVVIGLTGLSLVALSAFFGIQISR